MKAIILLVLFFHGCLSYDRHDMEQCRNNSMLAMAGRANQKIRDILKQIPKGPPPTEGPPPDGQTADPASTSDTGVKVVNTLAQGFTIMEKGADFLSKFEDFSASADKASKAAQKVLKGLAAAKNVLGAVSAIAAFAGPIGAGLSAVMSIVAIFIPQPDPNEAVLKMLEEKFALVFERLDRLLEKIDGLSLTVEKTAVYQTYKENQDRIQDVLLKYQQLLQQPGNATLDELKRACTNELDPHYSLNWIYRYVLKDKEEFKPHLLPTIFADIEYDRRRLLTFVQIIQSDFKQAVILREVCIGVVHPNDTAFLYNSRQDSARKMSVVFTKLAELDRRLTDTFQGQVKKDVERELNNSNSPTDNEDKIQVGKALAKSIYEMLSVKYFWLFFHVQVAPTGDFMHNRVIFGDSNYYIEAEGHGRRAVVAWGEKDTMNNASLQSMKSLFESVDFYNLMHNGGERYEYRPENWFDSNNDKLTNFRSRFPNGLKDATRAIVLRKPFTSEPIFFNNAILINHYLKGFYHGEWSLNRSAFVPGISHDVGLFYLGLLFHTSKDKGITLGCLGGENELQNVSRDEACPPAAFKNAVNYTVHTALQSLKEIIREDTVVKSSKKDTTAQRFKKIFIHIYEFLKAVYPDRHWSIFTHQTDNGNVVVLSCERSHSCTAAIVEMDKQKYQITVVWSARDPLLKVQTTASNNRADVTVCRNIGGSCKKMDNIDALNSTGEDDEEVAGQRADVNRVIIIHKKIARNPESMLVYNMDEEHAVREETPDAEFFMVYYKPYGMRNTLQCTTTKAELEKYNVTDVSAYGCPYEKRIDLC